MTATAATFKKASRLFSKVGGMSMSTYKSSYSSKSPSYPMSPDYRY